MRRGSCVTHPWHRAIAILAAAADAAAQAPAAHRAEFSSRAAVIEWIDGYRHKPEPSRVPDAVQALEHNRARCAIRRHAGFYVGFVAGVLGANPDEAERLVAEMLPLPPGDQWLVVRAIAYSGLPAWKSLLARIAERIAGAARHDRRLSHRRAADARRDRTRQEPDLSRKARRAARRQAEAPAGLLRPQSGTARHAVGPVFRDRPVPADLAHHHAVAVVEGPRQRASGSTVGSAAKYTLANNAARYPDMLALIKDMAAYQEADVRPILKDVIRAAETTETAAIRKEQLALVDKLKSKGPGYQRDMKTWGYVGQGAIGVTCVVLATMSLSAAGLPCVIGGAATSAALNYWAAQ